MRIYLDSAVIIYDVEQVSPYSELLNSRLSADDLVIATSDLARLECRESLKSWFPCLVLSSIWRLEFVRNMVSKLQMPYTSEPRFCQSATSF